MDGGGNARKTSTYKRDMSLTKNLILKKRTKLVVGTFFQLSGATLEILVSLSTKKNSLSDQRIEKRTEKKWWVDINIVWLLIYLHHTMSYTVGFWFVHVLDVTSTHSITNIKMLCVLFTINISKAKVEMFHQVGVSHDHVKHIPSSGLHLTFDQDALTVWHQHAQLSLGGWRFPFLWLQDGEKNLEGRNKWQDLMLFFSRTHHDGSRQL